ncbi:MAG TPA: hypothetical protein DCS93_21100 [Microscillaceae bacterium]|nr:hypothetical protein [Microscillaceae bacterium]
MKMIRQPFVILLILIINVGLVKAQYLSSAGTASNAWLNHPNNLSLGGGINFQNNGYSHLQFKGIMSGTGHVQLDLRKYTGTGNGFDNGRIMTFHPTRGVTMNGIGMNFETGGYSHVQMKPQIDAGNLTRLAFRKYTGTGDGFDGGEFFSLYGDGRAHLSGKLTLADAGMNFQAGGYSHLQFKGVMSGTGHVQLDLRKYTGTGDGFDNGRIMTFHPTRGMTLNGVGMNFETGGYSHVQIKAFKNASNTTRLDVRKYTGVGDGFDGGEFVSFTHDGKVGIGTINPDTDALLTVKGKANAREVKVHIEAGKDIVFQNDYNLMPLEQVEAFIQQNKHLPEVAPARVMEKEGVELGKFNMTLLQKVEELTLHTIAQEKEIKQLKRTEQQKNAEITQLKKDNNKMQNQILQMMKRLEALEKRHK